MACRIASLQPGTAHQAVRSVDFVNVVKKCNDWEICVCVCIQVRVWLRNAAYECAYLYRRHAYRHTCIHAHTHTYMHTYIHHTYIHAYIHTYVQKIVHIHAFSTRHVQAVFLSADPSWEPAFHMWESWLVFRLQEQCLAIIRSLIVWDLLDIIRKQHTCVEDTWLAVFVSAMVLTHLPMPWCMYVYIRCRSSCHIHAWRHCHT